MIFCDFQDKQLSLLGFGTMRLPTLPDGGIDEAQVRKMVALAMENGVNYFDTAFPYHSGNSERIIGKILNEYLGFHTHRRRNGRNCETGYGTQ